MGNAVGIKTEETKLESDERVALTEDGEIDYKKSSGFASFIGKRDAAVSEFTKAKSMRQQREYLPIFSVREELLNVVRENSVVVIVGETGSGKTTQL